MTSISSMVMAVFIYSSGAHPICKRGIVCQRGTVGDHHSFVNLREKRDEEQADAFPASACTGCVLIQEAHLSTIHIINGAHDLDFPVVLHFLEDRAVDPDLFHGVVDVAFANHVHEFLIF